MSYESTLDEGARDTNSFYRRTLHVLSDASVPFLVGGSHAFLQYTGIVRSTKDFDLFVLRDDLDRALASLRDAGYRTEVTFPHWLAKAHQGNDHVDLVFASGNGICVIDDGWFEHAVEADVLGMPVRIAPPEELLWQKAFVMERERFDGADITHLLRVAAERLDWPRILERFGANWPLLYSYIVYFSFVYPSERHRIPRDVLTGLTKRYEEYIDTARGDEEPICQGTLTSRGQYMIDIGQYGYRDARVQPLGNMTPEDVVYWTWAIDHVK